MDPLQLPPKWSCNNLQKCSAISSEKVLQKTAHCESYLPVICRHAIQPIEKAAPEEAAFGTQP